MNKSVLLLAGCGVWCAALALMPLSSAAGEPKEKSVAKPLAVNKSNEQYDLNKDGLIDAQEHVAMSADRAAKSQARLLAKYDANKNGQLDLDEQAKREADLEANRVKAAERRKVKAAEKAAGAAPVPDDPNDPDDEDPPMPKS